MVKEFDVNKIIFENDLTPTQVYNLAKLTGVEAIDRFQLILEIFSRRASTREANLQIKLANLRHQIPRAKESVRLARQGEQPGFRGLGRYEVEVYFEMLKRQMSSVRQELYKISSKRKLHRERRTELGFSLISLAGYTNSGKSTLFKALTEVPVTISQGLFTTLTTKTRAAHFNERKVLLTDTVGFIDRLPIELIQSFRSTLEETKSSDAIILLLDSNEPTQVIKSKYKVCINTINEIGAGHVPIITALNKIDRLATSELNKKTLELESETDNLVQISALNKINLNKLINVVNDNLEAFLEVTFSIPLNDETMAFLSSLYEKDVIVDVKYQDKTVVLRTSSKTWIINRISSQVSKLKGEIIEPSM